jgi:predicted SAM-dependent methyltransferase
MKLHIGGTEPKEGWKMLDIQPAPHVDYVADIRDLSQFSDESFDEIYASHVAEHIPYSNNELVKVLAGFHRILKADGVLKLSVPDMETLCWMFTSPRLSAEAKFHVMRMIFGGQVDAHDFHYVGLSFDILQGFLSKAGFEKVERVKAFELFDDSSSQTMAGIPISLNVEARRQA